MKKSQWKFFKIGKVGESLYTVESWRELKESWTELKELEGAEGIRGRLRSTGDFKKLSRGVDGS